MALLWRTMRCRVFVCCFFACVAAFVSSARAAGDDDDGDDMTPLNLSPVPLARPSPKVVDAEPRPLAGACNDEGLPMLRERLPFGPGEQLTFDIAMVGVRAGRVSLRVDDRSRVDGIDVYPVQARARTDRFLAAFGQIDASMVSFLDPATAQPSRMANRTVTRELFDRAPSTTREDAVFAPAYASPSGPRGGKVVTKLEHYADGKTLKRSNKASSRADVVDILSIVYWLRSRELVQGDRFCFEMFHRRRMWRVEGTVGGVAETASPFATRKARRLDLAVQRNRPGQPSRALTVWVSDDADRLPLLLSTPDRIEVKLTGFKAGRALVRPNLAPLSPVPALPVQPAPPPGPGAAVKPTPPAARPTTPQAPRAGGPADKPVVP